MLGIALRRPVLLPALVGLGWATRRRGWWRRFPFLPIPPASYVHWRMETAYGDPNAVPPEGDLVRYLAWTRRMRRSR